MTAIGVRLEQYWPSQRYFVGPDSQGPAAVVEAYEQRWRPQGPATIFSLVIDNITGYSQPPAEGGAYFAWRGSEGSKDSLTRFKPQPYGTPQALGVALVLEVRPPLRDEAHVRLAAAVFGEQALACAADPSQPNTVLAALGDAGVPFGIGTTVVTTVIAQS